MGSEWCATITVDTGFAQTRHRGTERRVHKHPMYALGATERPGMTGERALEIPVLQFFLFLMGMGISAIKGVESAVQGGVLIPGGWISTRGAGGNCAYSPQPWG